MTEMEDRVETAIYEACDYALPPHLLRKATRAAIEAMREPTEDMINAGCQAANGLSDEEHHAHSWRAMVDHALVP